MDTPDRQAVDPAERHPAEVSDLVVHETVDPEWIVGEFSYTIGRAANAVPCVFVMCVRAGLIVESRDYMDLAMFGRAIAAARER